MMIYQMCDMWTAIVAWAVLWRQSKKVDHNPNGLMGYRSLL